MAIDRINHALPLAHHLRRQIKHFAPLAAIVLLHVGFFHALQSGLLKQAVAAMPKEVIATFITPEPKPEAPKPQAAPKMVPVVKQTPPHPRPAVPVVNTEPAPQAITEPPATPVAQAPASAPAVAAAPAPVVPAGPKTITTGIAYLQAPQPDYPPISRRMGEEGKTILRVLVNDKGRPEQVEIQKSSGSARLDEAARQAVLRALFKPFMDDGKTIAAYAIIPIRFQLDN